MIFSQLVSGNELTYNDTFFDAQWGIKNKGQSLFRRSGELQREEVKGVPGMDINHTLFSRMFPSIPSDREVLVAVIDSGVDTNHPDLKDKIFFDKKLCEKVEDSTKLPCKGINLLKRNGNVQDDLGHGTHIAGIIAALSGNKTGVVGVSDSRIKILPIKVLSKDTNDFIYNNRLMTDIFADAIAYAIKKEAKVINISMGWPKVIETPKIKKAIEYALKQDIVIVAAAGNNNKQVPLFPCTYENVLCVGAIDNQGKIAEFSNYGGKVDVLAPGESIISTYPRENIESRVLRVNGYESIKGTSQASPFVSAIVASLKLLNPEMSLNEVLARIKYNAKSKLISIKDGKFSKYGLVDMKKSLEIKPERFIEPVYKNLLEVKFKNDENAFRFSLPIKSLIGNFDDVTVSLSFDRTDIKLYNPTQKLVLKEGQRKKLYFEGNLTSLSGDSNFKLKVLIKKGSEVLSNTQTTLIFSKDLTNYKLKEINDFTSKELTYFRGVRKAVRVKKIGDPEFLTAGPSYYTVLESNQTQDFTRVDFLVRKNGVWTKERLRLPKKHEIISLNYHDLDLDGDRDLLVSAVNMERDSLTFDYIFNIDKESVPSQKSFRFPILSYKDFPLKHTDFKTFSMRVVQTPEGGLLKVPAFYASYLLPEEDNTFDILERVPDDLNYPHVFYFNPIREGGELVFKLRVVDSYEAIKSFQHKYMIENWEPIQMERPFPVSTKDLRDGLLRGIVSVGMDFMKKYYLYTIDKSGIHFEDAYFPEYFVSDNPVRPLISLNPDDIFQRDRKVNFLLKFKREQVRSLVWDWSSSEKSALILDTEKYSDPIFNVLFTFNDAQKTRFVESRYFLKFFDEQGLERSLRINRESSFPGVQFSETLSPVVVKGKFKNHPGIFMNSTLIFGDRIYTMVRIGNKFLRPLNLSVSVPKNCIHMRPELIDGVFSYLMMCRNGSKAAFLQVPVMTED